MSNYQRQCPTGGRSNSVGGHINHSAWRSAVLLSLLLLMGSLVSTTGATNNMSSEDLETVMTNSEDLHSLLLLKHRGDNYNSITEQGSSSLSLQSSHLKVSSRYREKLRRLEEPSLDEYQKKDQQTNRRSLRGRNLKKDHPVSSYDDDDDYNGSDDDDADYDDDAEYDDDDDAEYDDDGADYDDDDGIQEATGPPTKSPFVTNNVVTPQNTLATIQCEVATICGGCVRLSLRKKATDPLNTCTWTAASNSCHTITVAQATMLKYPTDATMCPAAATTTAGAAAASVTTNAPSVALVAKPAVVPVIPAALTTTTTSPSVAPVAAAAAVSVIPFSPQSCEKFNTCAGCANLARLKDAGTDPAYTCLWDGTACRTTNHAELKAKGLYSAADVSCSAIAAEAAVKVAPTLTPSSAPVHTTIAPVATPLAVTQAPTIMPSKGSTTAPSVTLATTTAQTTATTLAPTLATTIAPTISKTLEPTVGKTLAPTTTKTIAPTTTKTIATTVAPTTATTVAPTTATTVAPTTATTTATTVAPTTATTVAPTIVQKSILANQKIVFPGATATTSAPVAAKISALTAAKTLAPTTAPISLVGKTLAPAATVIKTRNKKRNKNVITAPLALVPGVDGGDGADETVNVPVPAKDIPLLEPSATSPEQQKESIPGKIIAAKQAINDASRHGDLDIKRKPFVFDTDRVRTAGRIYEDVLEVQVETSRAKEGLEDTTGFAVVDIGSNITVDDNEAGGTRFETSIVSLTSRNIHGDTIIQCDISTGDKATAPDICKAYYDLNGNLFHLVIDETGNITAFAEKDGVDDNTHHLAVQSLLQTARLLQLIPSRPMRPRTKLPVREYFHDEMGLFRGATALLGYSECNGHDCAVFSTDGNLNVNTEELLKKWGFADLIDHETVDVREATYSAMIQWDNDEGLIRSSKATMSITMQYIDPLDKSTISFQVDETIHLTSSVKE